MNNEWMRQKLTDYLARQDAWTAVRDAWSAADDEDDQRSDKLQKKMDEIYRELVRGEPTIKQILKNLDPDLARYKSEKIHMVGVLRDVVVMGLGILADRDEWKANLAPEGPVVPVDQFHPWVWDAARTLWDSGHYRLAVQAAATAINAHAQTRLGRRDIADNDLMREAFATQPPRPGQPRLRCPGNPSDQTVRSRQRGALQYAIGCFTAIRNPATHEHNEWDQQAALESLAAFSMLARWIADWKLTTAP